MKIIPAIDIRNGKCVRLFQGKYDQETIYGDNPEEMALKWYKAGARILHIVDLDGAKSGRLENIEIIKRIITTTGLSVQVGGGIRDQISARNLFDCGVSKIIVGTMALENIALLSRLLEEYKRKIIVSIDLDNNKVMEKGWLEKSETKMEDLVKVLEKIEVKTIIYTDIVRDGTLTEPNYTEIEKIRSSTRLELLLAGGISTLDHIKKLKSIGVDGVIVGKALYEGKIDLREAINAG